jgi:hypothetical protein
MFDMVSAALAPSRSRWLVALGAIAILFSLTGHWIADVINGLSDPVAVGQGDRDNSLASSQAETYNLMADSALPMMIGIARLHPVAFPLKSPRPARLAWFPLPPVRPPIMLH